MATALAVFRALLAMLALSAADDEAMFLQGYAGEALCDVTPDHPVCLGDAGGIQLIQMNAVLSSRDMTTKEMEMVDEKRKKLGDKIDGNKAAHGSLKRRKMLVGQPPLW